MRQDKAETLTLGGRDSQAHALHFVTATLSDADPLALIHLDAVPVRKAVVLRPHAHAVDAAASAVSYPSPFPASSVTLTLASEEAPMASRAIVSIATVSIVARRSIVSSAIAYLYPNPA